MKKFNFLLSSLLFISSISVSNPVFAQQSDYQDLKEYVNNYINFVEKSKSELSIDNEEVLKYYSSKDSLDYLYLNALINYRKVQLTDLKFQTISNNINIESITEHNNIYDIELTKNSRIIYNCMDGDVSEEMEFHDLTIEKNGTDFIVLYDNNYDEYRQELGISKNADIERVKSNAYELLAKTKISVQEEKENLNKAKLQAQTAPIKEISDIEQISSTSKISIQSTKFTKHSYDRKKARTYALDYVLSPNPKYTNYESMKGNCTNFTSQCLYAGGIVQDKIGNYTWYYTSESKSASWKSANSFRTYYKNNVGSSTVKGLNAKTCSFKKTRLGDLVQIVNSNKASHTMFISGYVADNWASDNPWEYKSDVKICQNSTSKGTRLKDVPLKSKGISPNSLEYIHITGSYY